ncbi:MAG: MoaD/ThiS family protein [Chloroflexota bacterium]|nr:MoaD/ThiS family protein [Chloroflexota bacterium]
MKVTARLHATLRRPVSDGYQNRVTVELDEGATVASLLKTLEIGLAPEHLLVLLGQQRIDPEHALHDGDAVQIFPPISGG